MLVRVHKDAEHVESPHAAWSARMRTTSPPRATTEWRDASLAHVDALAADVMEKPVPPRMKAQEMESLPAGDFRRLLFRDARRQPYPSIRHGMGAAAAANYR